MLKITEPKKVLCIHDLSGVGRCSLAVILPVLSVMGVQPVALPTVVLSTHTGGFGTPARLDGCAYGEAALEHYRELGLSFDCIYTGYLGGEEQAALAEKAFDLWPSAYKVVDPVMGDNGKAYATVTPAFIDRMRQLCRRADLILPNATEPACCWKKSCPPSWTRKAPGAGRRAGGVADPQRGGHRPAAGQVHRLRRCRPRPLRGQEAAYCPQLPRHGRPLRCGAHRLAHPGQRLSAAADNAAEFVALAIQKTPCDQDTRFGVWFEPLLPRLCPMGEE